MKYKNKKFIAIALVAVNLFLFSAAAYLYFKTQEKTASVLTARAEISRIDNSITAAKSIERLLKDMADEKDKIDSIFLNKENIIEFIKELENLASESGVLLELSSANVPEFKFKLFGEFGDIFRYLEILEKISYRIIFEQADIQVFGVANKKNQWRADITLSLASFLDDYEKN